MADTIPIGEAKAAPRGKHRRRLLPGLLRRRDAAAFCAMSVASWDRASAAALVPRPRKIGHCLAWSRHELLAWIRAGCVNRAEWEARNRAGEGRR